MCWSIMRDVVGVVLVLLAVGYAYFKWRYQYWKKRGVPCLEPSIPFGNFPNPLLPRRKPIGLYKKRTLYAKIKSKGYRHCGLYSVTSPCYMPVDLDYVKNIMTKDFQYFVDRGFYYNETDDPLSANLFAIGGVKWRNLRTKLTPTFTSGKLKGMFQTLVDCESTLLEVMEERYGRREPVDVKEILSCFTINVIGSCAFGLDCNTFKDDDSPFRKYCKKVFLITKLTVLKAIIAQNSPELARKFGITISNSEVAKFYLKLVKDAVNYRENNNVDRKDFLQLLIELKNKKLGDRNDYQNDGKTLTMNEIAAQSYIFFVAGFEASSTTMTFALYEMARHPEFQERARKEIETVLAKFDNKVCYDAINEMKYMNQVVEETLRMYPGLPYITRVCVKDYKIPDQDVVIEKGTRVIIPIRGIHYDESYYKNPETFDPERFNEENKSTRNQYAHIPFGEGPRICIGSRFGMMQSKVGLAALLRNYRFTVNPKTREPLEMSAKSFLPLAIGGIWLDAEKIETVDQ